VILGLISEKMHEGGCHPYDINKRIEERGMRAWTNIGVDFSFSTIYRTLDRLEGDGLVESYEEEMDGRKRKNYTITKMGYDILKKRVYDVLNNYIGKNDEDFYVAFSMYPLLTEDELVEVFTNSIMKIRNHKIELQEMLDDNQKKFPDITFNVEGLFLHPIKILEVDEDFFKMALKKIKKIGD
jgi:DNA-binding PadR family transcriptional regulator